MRVMVAGEDNYAPEVFARAVQLVWHYGFFSITNFSGLVNLKDIWEREHPELMDDQGRGSFRALVLAGRSLFYNKHVCDDTCVGLPESPIEYNGYRCQYCDGPFDPISTRYLCPYDDCKMKNTCCEG